MSVRAEARKELLTLVRSLKGRVDLDLQDGHRPAYLSRGTMDEVDPAIGAPFATERSAVTAAPPGMAIATLEDVRAELGDCQRCGLGRIRHQLVFGEGNPRAELVFVGEAPGRDEDAQGRPFVGPAGQLLTKIIEAMGLKRQEVYICNILKCRPPGNRNPQPDEMAACEPFLVAQLKALQPRVICALGSFAAHALLGTDAPISALRGQFHTYQGMDLMPTYHPAYLLRNPGAKKQVWSDVQIIMKRLRGER